MERIRFRRLGFPRSVSVALAGRVMDPIIPAIRPDPFDDGLSCSNSSSTPSLSAGEWDKTPLPAHSPIFLSNLPLLRHV